MRIKSLFGIFRADKLEETREGQSGTDEDEVDLEDITIETQLPEKCGVLSKWTNYMNGWQDRFIVVKQGTLGYYKSEEDMNVGCRGTVSLSKAVISAHEFDDCRFDVGLQDSLWYLRATSSEERLCWMNILDVHKRAESGYGSESSLRRHGSHLSLASATSLSTTASASSFKRGRGLKEKLMEMDTFKDILSRQVDMLQNYFDACSSAVTQLSEDDSSDDLNEVPDEFSNLTTTNVHNNPNNSHNNNTNNTTENQDYNKNKEDKSTSHLHDINNRDLSHKDLINMLKQHGAHAIDFKGQAMTFKTTTVGILTTLSHCIELMAQREEAWKKKLDKEIDKRKRHDDGYRQMLDSKMKPVILRNGGPDFEEGPHSMLNDEEFYDAIDATLDKLEKDEELKIQTLEASTKLERIPNTCLSTIHPLYGEINKQVDDHINHADMSASDVADTWTLVASEGEMKVYKREVEDGGNTVYPLKAVHSVKGITGHELCQYFWEPKVRLEWESTLESTQVLEWLSTDTHVTYQVLKRVWPAAQRDSIFWSTIRHCPANQEKGNVDYWAVVNQSTNHLPSPSSDRPQCIRLQFNVAMIGQTIVEPPPNGQPITREHLTCKIQYSANVSPGGWVPSSVIQAICKREAPKFLRNFTAYVIDKTKNKPIIF